MCKVVAILVIQHGRSSVREATIPCFIVYPDVAHSRSVPNRTKQLFSAQVSFLFSTLLDDDELLAEK